MCSPFTAEAAAALSAALPVLDPSRSGPQGEPQEAYFSHYGLNFPGAKHYFGGIPFGRGHLATHVFVPHAPGGTVLFLHGYLQHSGLQAGMIGQLVSAGYSVIAFDLPGHGLSSGERADIDDFSSYSEALETILRFFRETIFLAGSLPEPFCFLGHSTGCSVLMEYLYARDLDAGAIVFAAPLIRSGMWTLSGIAYFLFGRLLKRVPRWDKTTSGDREFLNLMRYGDSLRIPEVPLGWVRAHRRWNRRIPGYPDNGARIVVIQGDRDDVVGWRYNLRFLRSHFPRMTFHLIKGARHDILQEEAGIRNEAFSYIREALEEIRKPYG